MVNLFVKIINLNIIEYVLIKPVVRIYMYSICNPKGYVKFEAIKPCTSYVM